MLVLDLLILLFVCLSLWFTLASIFYSKATHHFQKAIAFYSDGNVTAGDEQFHIGITLLAKGERFCPPIKWIRGESIADKYADR